MGEINLPTPRDGDGQVSRIPKCVVRRQGHQTTENEHPQGSRLHPGHEQGQVQATEETGPGPQRRVQLRSRGVFRKRGQDGAAAVQLYQRLLTSTYRAAQVRHFNDRVSGK